MVICGVESDVDDDCCTTGVDDGVLVKRSTSALPVIRCKARYDSRAWRFRAAAAAELAGSRAACCKLDTIAPCRDRTTAAAAAKSPDGEVTAEDVVDAVVIVAEGTTDDVLVGEETKCVAAFP